MPYDTLADRGETLKSRGKNATKTIEEMAVADLFRFLFFLVFFASGVATYFLPSLIAWSRNHRDTLAIFLLDMFLGWSLLGWVVALVWSVKAGCDTAPMPVTTGCGPRRVQTVAGQDWPEGWGADPVQPVAARQQDDIPDDWLK